MHECKLTNKLYDGPAIERGNGYKAWYKDGKRHRLDGPAYEYANGTKEWCIEDKRHRLDGPAYEDANGHKEWYIEGKRHRLDGPAIERANGSKAWYIEGNKLTEEEFNKRTKAKSIDDILKQLSKDYEVTKVGDTILITKKKEE